MRRRRFLAVSAAALLALVAAGLSPRSPLPWRLFGHLPGYRVWLAGRLRRALAAVVGEGAAAPPAVGLAPADAAEKLVAGLSRAGVADLLASADALRAHVEARQRRDLREGRMRTVHGWLLSETEICLAALLAGGERS